MLLDQIQTDLNVAMKSHDQNKVDTLRFLLGGIKSLGIEKYPPSSGKSLTDEDVLSVISKQVKSHKESIAMFEQGNRPELVSKEQGQLSILQSYLPAQMGEEEIKQKIEALKANNPGADFPVLIKLAMGELKGKADGGTVSKILKEVLQ